MCVLLFVSHAAAQEAVPVALSYSAPSSCPAQGRFVARLRMHTQRVQWSNEPDALVLQVIIVRTSQGFSGKLAVAQQGRPVGTRAFEGHDCPDVVWALALSAALSIDPEATLTVASEEPTGETGAEPDDLGASDNAAGAGQESPRPANSADSAEAHNESDASTMEALPPLGEAPSEKPGGATLWSIGPVLSASFAFDPKAAIGGGLVAAVRDTSGRTVLPLELALRLEYLGTRWTRGSDPLVLDWWSANLLACPFRAGEGLTVLVCGVGQVGWIHAQGVDGDGDVDVQQTEAVWRSFFSLGLGLWARQRIGDHWELSGVADVKVPLVDRAFALATETETQDLEVVSSSRPLGVGVSLGAVYGF